MSFVSGPHSGFLKLAILLVGFAEVGCTGTVVDEDGERLGTLASPLLNFPSSRAAETVVTSVVNGVTVVSYNEDDPGFITYNNNSRQVAVNASQMGFFQLSPDDEGGVGVSGRVRPPAGWTVLWGDPAITRNRANSARVYLANLAIPSAKFSSGVIEGPVNPSGLPANFCGAYIGGACIARSSNSGASFTLAAGDCLQRVTASCPNGTFYDGSDIETRSDGRVYAAFTDVTRSSTDVYLATSSTGAFARVTDPPNGGNTIMHPRLKAGPSGMYLLQLVGSSTLMISRYPSGSSRTQAWTTPVQVATSVTATDIVLSDRSLRLGPEYAMDIGPNENGVDEVRIAYTVIVAGRHHVRIAKCTTGATITCSQPAAWRTDASAGLQWHPAIVTGINAAGSRFWSFSYHSTQNFAGQNKVELWRGSLPNSNQLSTTRQETSQIPCPDNRGYWGDYDTMATGTNFAGTPGFTLRGMTQSFSGACTRAQYVASPQWGAVSYWTL